MSRRASRERQDSALPRASHSAPVAERARETISIASRFLASRRGKHAGKVSAHKSFQDSKVSAGRFVPDDRGQLIAGGLLVGMLLIALGTILLRSNSLLLGTIVVIAGLGLFLIASGYVSTITWSRVEVAGMARSGLPASAVVSGLFFCALATNEVATSREPKALTLAALYWVFSVVCFAAGVLGLEHWRPRLAAFVVWIRANFRELLIVAVVLAAALASRLYALDNHPYPWSGDEATVAGEADSLLRSQVPDPFNSGWSGNPLPAFYPAAAVESFLGSSVHAVRVTSAITGALTVLFLYLLARELFDRTIALIAAAFLITFPFHLQFSRVGVLTIQDGFVVTFVLWLVFRAIHQNRLSNYLWAGIASGLTLYAYIGGRLVLVLAFAAFAFVCARQK